MTTSETPMIADEDGGRRYSDLEEQMLDEAALRLQERVLLDGTELNNVKGLHSMKKVLPVELDVSDSRYTAEDLKALGIAERAGNPRGGFWRRLPRFRTVNGKRQQLHATRGWKAA